MTSKHTNDSEHTSEAIVHTNIGRGGVIIECRPVGQDYPSESDMAHLSDEQAKKLRDKLNQYLGTDDEP